ncbi:MAG: molybdopterin oxidoreductase family protein, partial [Marmoricola sp.]
MARTDTHCPYCALQCGMHLDVGKSSDGGDITVTPRDFPTNRGGLCQKGWTSARVLTAADRITTPLIRDSGGALQPASWDEALGFIADRVRAIQADSGKDAVAVFGSGALTNEKAYQLGKFARLALGTRYIDYNGRFCMSSAAAASNRALGLDRGLPFPLTDVGEASAVLLLGSNVSDTMPPLVQHLGPVRDAGGLIVVDPRHSATAALTDGGAGVHLQPLPGSDLVLLLGLLHIVIAQGWADEEYLASRTVGWEDVRRSVSLWWPSRVCSRTGVPEGRLYEAAEILAKASPSRRGKGAIVLTGRGVEQHTDGTNTVTAAINLALALGLPGRAHSGYGCLTGQGNGQGGREHGQKADQLPGYRSIEDPAAREHVARVWGVDPELIPGKGVPAVELLAKLGGEVRGLFVHGANPVVSAPDARAVQQRIAALDLVVVCDFVPSET